ncbi:MAG: DUF1080 domain-containing protein [Pirellulaceae bacterium]|jgi:hypothetical protein|nr:DUF1080 domain-containing protein [Pirellulaceae bacterium]MDP7018920.1 DUF1080 domain-containing protein [Pirellulaceae bacterium]
MKRLLLAAVATLALTGPALAADDDGWTTIFDGKSFKGWKASENKDSWSIEEGAFVCDGPRSHLFFMGADKPFKNFEFRCKVKTLPGSNAGIYFHTRYQQEGWPKYGYESQVNITHGDPIKTGSLYGVVNVSKPPAKDNEYWTQHIIVKGRHVVIKVNGKTLVDYTEPKDKAAFSKSFERRLGSGTFAFQAHDPKSKVYFKDIQVKRLD